jgi:flavorubredoxin
MNRPTMFAPRQAAPGVDALPSYLPVPSFGLLPVNAYLIGGAQPVLVDTGLAALQDEFLRGLGSLIALEQLRWIWLTHTDPDHLGNLAAVLERAPRARVVTTFLGMGKLGLAQLPVDRAYLLNPGEVLNVGDRQLLALRPPAFDAPETTGLFDLKTRVLFSADCFGALLDAPAETAAEVPPDRLRDGLVTWATVDVPWLHSVDAAAFGKALDTVRRLDAGVILSSHLPPAFGMTEGLLRHLAAARAAPPFEGPTQPELERLMAAA